MPDKTITRRNFLLAGAAACGAAAGATRALHPDLFGVGASAQTSESRRRPSPGYRALHDTIVEFAEKRGWKGVAKGFRRNAESWTDDDAAEPVTAAHTAMTPPAAAPPPVAKKSADVPTPRQPSAPAAKIETAQPVAARIEKTPQPKPPAQRKPTNPVEAMLRKYPEYIPMFRDASRAHGIDAVLLAAQTQRESNGDPTAKSDVGALGVSQFLTRAIALEHNVTDRFDPRQSIMGQAHFVAQLLRKYDDEKKALAAYNFGPANLDETIKRHGHKHYFGHLPQETQDYVNDIRERAKLPCPSLQGGPLLVAENTPRAPKYQL